MREAWTGQDRYKLVQFSRRTGINTVNCDALCCQTDSNRLIKMICHDRFDRLTGQWLTNSDFALVLQPSRLSIHPLTPSLVYFVRQFHRSIDSFIKIHCSQKAGLRTV